MSAQKNVLNKHNKEEKVSRPDWWGSVLSACDSVVSDNTDDPTLYLVFYDDLSQFLLH